MNGLLKQLIKHLFTKWLFLVCLGLLINNSYAREISDAAALNGVTEAKSVFLIDFTNPVKTASYLNIIRGTHNGLLRQNVKSDMVLVFIGPTVKFITNKPNDELTLEFGSELKSIQDSIKEFAKLGVRMEVCVIATKVFNIDNKTIPQEMNLVADGFISLIGWQTQGHKLVPIF